MSQKALTPVNVPWLAADPAGPSLHAGDLYGNSGTGALRVYNGTAWATVGAGGSGTPATTVVAETGWGQASAVGTATNYAREDHTHGTPAAPTAADVTGGTFPGTYTVAGTLSVSGALNANGITTLGGGSGNYLNFNSNPFARLYESYGMTYDPSSYSGGGGVLPFQVRNTALLVGQPAMTGTAQSVGYVVASHFNAAGSSSGFNFQVRNNTANSWEWYSPSGDAVLWSNTNSDRMRVDNGGNVVAFGGVYESNGGVRVYSSNNAPPYPNHVTDHGYISRLSVNLAASASYSWGFSMYSAPSITGSLIGSQAGYFGPQTFPTSAGCTMKTSYTGGALNYFANAIYN